jgi:GNAT superfamily N-acetyltransferase
MTKNMVSSTLQIVPCNLEDVQTISEVAIRSYKDFYLYLWHDDGSWYINRSFSQSVLNEEIKDRNHAFFLLNEKHNPVGFLKLNIERPLKKYEQYNCIELERIYLIKSATGKGYGQHAMNFCFDYARGLKKDILWLKAMDSSAAVSFYESLGFEHCGSFSLEFSQMKEEFRGMVIMMKRLAET